MTQSQTYYRFVGLRNENLGISNTSNPELLMKCLIKDGVDIGGFQIMDTNEALCELSQRKDNPLPMDYTNLDNQGYDVDYSELYATHEL